MISQKKNHVTIFFDNENNDMCFLKINFEKTRFVVISIIFNHVVSSQRIEIDHRKKSSIKNFSFSIIEKIIVILIERIFVKTIRKFRIVFDEKTIKKIMIKLNNFRCFE